jgi:hypothetical protein
MSEADWKKNAGVREEGKKKGRTWISQNNAVWMKDDMSSSSTQKPGSGSSPINGHRQGYDPCRPTKVFVILIWTHSKNKRAAFPSRCC